MERTIDKIRRAYPIPVTVAMADKITGGFSRPDVYCVYLAGLRWFAKHNLSFPTTLLEERTIITVNDSGNFELAWELLAKAIERSGKVNL